MKRGEILETVFADEPGAKRDAKLCVFEHDTYSQIMILDPSGDAYISLSEDDIEKLKELLTRTKK